MKPYLNIKYILETGNLKSMVELAEKLGVHYQTVIFWNSKKSSPRLKDLLKICDLLNTRNINDFILYK